MNTANLQLEGLVMAIAATNRLLAEKGLLSHQEIDAALAEAQASFEQKTAQVSDSNRKGILFPIRVLRLANRAGERAEPFDFQSFARMVGDQA